MAKYKNRYGEIAEIEPATKFDRGAAVYFTLNWLPFIFKEITEMNPPTTDDFFTNNILATVWLNSRNQINNFDNPKYPFHNRLSDGSSIVDIIRNLFENNRNYQQRVDILKNKSMTTYLHTFWKLGLMPLDGKKLNKIDNPTEWRNLFTALETAYKFDPEKERRQKEAVAQQQVEDARIKELDTHIQQLNKNLEVSHQQNSILQRNVDFLNKEQNRIVNETKKSFEQQANKLVEYNTQTQNAINQLSQESQKAFNKTQEDTSRAFIQFQKTVEDNFRERGEAYDRNLQNFRESAENELSYIKQNHGVLMEKLHNRIRKRMLSDAPELKASYNFFADIFAGNK